MLTLLGQLGKDTWLELLMFIFVSETGLHVLWSLQYSVTYVISESIPKILIVKGKGLLQ